MAARSDPRTGAVTVTVDGVALTLLADFNAMCDFTQATGVDAFKFIDSMQGDQEPDMLLVREFIRAMLLQTHEDATLKMAGRVLTVAPHAMLDAVEAGTPDPEPKDTDDAAPGEAQAAPD